MRRYKSIGISKYRLYELRYFCLQYRQWKHNKSNTENVRLIEEVAEEAGGSISDWLLRAVTTEISCDKLIACGMPCGRDYFYERRRMFFEILDQEKNRTHGTPD